MAKPKTVHGDCAFDTEFPRLVLSPIEPDVFEPPRIVDLVGSTRPRTSACMQVAPAVASPSLDALDEAPARACLGKIKTGRPIATTETKGHGRIETRTGVVVGAAKLGDYHEFAGLKAFGRIEAIRDQLEAPDK